MDVQLGHRAEYAVSLCLELARRWHEGRVKARELMAATGTPPAFGAHVLADLVRAGIVTSTAGRAGGYELARAPESVSLLEVVQAVNPPGVRRCPVRRAPCNPDQPCVVHDALSTGRDRLADSMATADLLGLIADPT